MVGVAWSGVGGGPLLLVGCDLSLAVELGVQMEQPQAKGPQLQVYKESFEAPFLEETERFYAAERIDLGVADLAMNEGQVRRG